jgi:plasmid stabilization system protein ParE
MAVEWRLTPEADNDFASAYAWYESQRPGLGEYFTSRVEQCLDSILVMPTMHELVHKNYRRALVRRFPYAVLYKHDSQGVTVHAIFHTAQSPAKWRERLL